LESGQASQIYQVKFIKLLCSSKSQMDGSAPCREQHLLNGVAS